jgi:CheY-like chemotaxis protein
MRLKAPKRNSTFRLRIDLRASLRSAYDPTTMAEILIVDDDLQGCEPLARYLTHHGHAVVCTPNGRDAMNAVVTRTPHVVVLDLLMPQMDGPGFLQILRSYLRLRDLPVIVFTGAPNSPVADQAYKHGVAQVLAKATCKPSDVLSAVERALSGRAA